MQQPSEPAYADGGCLCGAVRYRVSGAPRSSSVCHCRSCRLASGAPAVAWVVFDDSRFEWLQGHPATRHSSAHVVRGFCARCGTPLSYRNDDAPHTIELTTATLDHPEQFPPACEIWLEHKLPWQPVSPDRPGHRQGSSDSPSDR
jgi:hypothetical protein